MQFKFLLIFIFLFQNISAMENGEFGYVPSLKKTTIEHFKLNNTPLDTSKLPTDLKNEFDEYLLDCDIDTDCKNYFTLKISPSGRYLIFGSYYLCSKIILFDIKSKKQKLIKVESSILELGFSPRENYFFLITSKEIKLFNLRSCECTHTIPCTNEFEMTGEIEISSNEKYVLYGQRSTYMPIVWNDFALAQEVLGVTNNTGEREFTTILYDLESKKMIYYTEPKPYKELACQNIMFGYDDKYLIINDRKTEILKFLDLQTLKFQDIFSSDIKCDTNSKMAKSPNSKYLAIIRLSTLFIYDLSKDCKIISIISSGEDIIEIIFYDNKYICVTIFESNYGIEMKCYSQLYDIESELLAAEFYRGDKFAYTNNILAVKHAQNCVKFFKNEELIDTFSLEKMEIKEIKAVGDSFCIVYTADDDKKLKVQYFKYS